EQFVILIGLYQFVVVDVFFISEKIKIDSLIQALGLLFRNQALLYPLFHQVRSGKETGPESLDAAGGLFFVELQGSGLRADRLTGQTQHMVNLWLHAVAVHRLKT